MMKLRINPLVVEDLKAIKSFIAEDNVDKALETVQEICHQLEYIQQFPYIGADLSKRVSFKTDYKYVVWGDYVVLYKLGKEVAEIYRVINRYQDITRVFDSK
jgi:addiction module RelE/StbE family toxin